MLKKRSWSCENVRAAVEVMRGAMRRRRIRSMEKRFAMGGADDNDDVGGIGRRV